MERDRARFLLSIKEVEKMQGNATKWVKMREKIKYEYGWWWLRSRGMRDMNQACYVTRVC